jgi:PIN like domain
MSDDNSAEEGTEPDNPEGQQQPKGQQQKQEHQHGKQQKLKQETDPFWIRRVFPDALRAIQFSSSPVSILFADAIFVLDTNTLLAPYQVGKQSVAEIERIYRELSSHDRLFVPEQAAREFAKNRGKKLTEVYDKVHSIASKLPSVEILDCPMLDRSSRRLFDASLSRVSG